MYSFGKKSLEELKGVEPRLVKVLTEAIKTSPIDFSIVEGVRSTATQQKYYSWGRTVKNPYTGAMPGKPLGSTNTNADGVKKKSNHQVKADGFGHAVDLYPYINGKIHFDNETALFKISDHIKSVAKDLGIAITWGGNWVSPFDPPHFELKQ